MSVRRRAGLVALLAASVISTLGSMMSLVAVPWLVLVTTGRPADMGLVVAAAMVPYLASSVLGAPLADRLGMRLTAVIADTVSAIATAVIAISPDIGLPAIAAMVGLSGLVRGAGDRTKHVLLRPAAEAAGVAIPRVTSVYDGLSNIATLAGAPLGGLIVYWVGPQGAVLVDAVSFALSAVLVAALTRPALEPAREPDAERYLPALLAGTRQLGRDGLLLIMVGTVFFANVVNQATGSLFIPLWVSEVLHSPAALGTVFGAVSAGAVLGNLVFTALAVKLSHYLVFAVGMAISGAPRVLVLGVSDSLTVVLTVSFLCGFAVAGVNPIFGAKLYERVPERFQTRVFGLVAAIAYAGFPIGGLLGGWAVAGLGLRTTILIAGGLYLVATIVPLVRYRAIQTRCAPVRDAPATKK
ncbi:MAG TPA: MFS transporter [Actinophytocola sp.]|uniref:MFS transporter n=1 Tax=Actinophytocola sp. TaxID=1872138 RepID=UPI002DB92F35|nr:MFS transporter [Actinophytocola sp.]HEU5473397.1 MFS transporter [Actinophytocola sp.]